jgi:hypothetical protein
MEALSGLKWGQLIGQGVFIALIVAWPYLYRKYFKPGFLAFYRDRRQSQNLCAIIGFVIGYPIAFYKMWTGIDLMSSSTAAIGYVFVPFFATIPSFFSAAIGYSIGAGIRAGRTRERKYALIAAIGVALSFASFAYFVVDADRDQNLAETVAAIARMDDAGLRKFLNYHEHRTNRYALGAVAMTGSASGTTLARIAALDDPALHEKYGGPPELMGGNRKGLAVMRLLARHANVEPATLEVLAQSRDSYVLGDVAANRATPRAVIERLYVQLGSTQDAYLIEWGLGNNVATPAEILRELAKKSRNQYTLRGIAANGGAPDDVRSLATQRVDSRDYQAH